MKHAKNIKLLPATVLSLLIFISAINFFNQITSDFKQGFSDVVLVDMSIFIAAGREFVKSGKLYARSEDYSRDYGPNTPVYKFPPTYQLTIVPLIKAGLSDTDLLLIQHYAYVFMYLSSIAILALVIGRALLKINERLHAAVWVYAGLLSLLTLWYAPFYDAFLNLYTEILILFLISASLLFLKKHPLVTGLLLSLAFLIKIYPGFILIHYFLTRQWRVVAGFIAAACLLSMFTLYYFGYQECYFYINAILPTLLNEKIANHSQNLMIEKFLYAHGLIDNISGGIHTSIKYISLGILILIALLKDKLILRSSMLYFGMFVCGTLIWLPNYWLQYQMILIIPIMTILAVAIDRQEKLMIFTIMMIGIIMCMQSQWYEALNQYLYMQIEKEGLIDYFKNHNLQQSVLYTLLINPSIVCVLLVSQATYWMCEMRSLIPHLLYLISAWILLRPER